MGYVREVLTLSLAVRPAADVSTSKDKGLKHVSGVYQE